MPVGVSLTIVVIIRLEAPQDRLAALVRYRQEGIPVRFQLPPGPSVPGWEVGVPARGPRLVLDNVRLFLPFQRDDCSTWIV